MSNAELLLRKMLERETSRWGDQDNALRRIATHSGIGYWTLWHISHGRSKRISEQVSRQIRTAYLKHCEQQIATLRHEIATETRKGADDMEDLDAEASALAAKIAALRAVER